MGRPRRLDVQDGWHHVMHRGAGGRVVFMTRHDGEEFERLLAHGVAESGVEVHAYCLMPNHFHLLVHCPDGGLSVFMQRMMSRYTRYANARLGRDGAPFRGRFRSKPIGSPHQIVNTSVSIHRNPDDTTRAGELHEYRWSSLRWYVADGDAPSWLSRHVVLGYFGDDPGRYLDSVLRRGRRRRRRRWCRCVRRLS